jgi:autotransporter-associated beta strand protein
MTTTTTNHRGSAAQAISVFTTTGPTPTTTTFGDQPMSSPTSSPARAAVVTPVLQCLGAISRSLFGIALAAAIPLVSAASALAQTWSPGSGYMAATLGGAPVFDTDPGSFFTTQTFDAGGGPAAMGIEAWVNLEPGTADMIGEEVAFGIAELGGFADRMGLYTTWDGTNHTLHYRAQGGSGPVVVTSGTTIAPGTWTHVAGTYSSTDIFAYVNGNETVNTSWDGDVGTRFYSNNTIGKVTQGVTTGDIDGYLAGQVTGFRVWNAKITPTTTNSPVTFDVSGATGILGNFQIGTNGDTTPLVGSPVGGTMTATANTGSPLTYEKTGGGSVTVTVDGFFADTIDAGTLEIGNGGTDGTLVTDIVDNGTLSFNRSNALTHSNVISGTGIVSQDGNGTTTLSAANSYQGATNVNAGTLRITNASSLGTTDAGTTVASGATLEIGGALTVAEGVTLGGGTLATSTGSGEVFLTGELTLSSDSLISVGTDSADELNLDGTISGAGGLSFSGNALLLGATNTYTGNTVVNSGTLFVTADGALGTNAGSTQVNAGGTLVMSDVTYATTEGISLNGGALLATGANSSLAGQVSVVADSAIDVLTGDTFTISGGLSGTAAVEVGSSGSNSGTLILSGTNTLNGTATITNGTLQIGAGGTSGSLAFGSVVNNGTFAFNRSDDISFGNVISGTGSVTKAGAGALTLSGANIYTGDTNVNAGTLSLTGSLTSDVIVASGATIAGSGLSTGSLSGAGSVDPGSSPGILAFASLDASAGMDFNFEFTAADPTYSNASNSANDVLRLTDATTPFTTALTSTSTVNIYLNVDSYTFGDEFRGGFFTDDPADFLTQVQNANFSYFLKDAGGAVTYNGVTYRNVTSNDWVLTTVPATADFAGGTVNGQVLQVVPEPSSFVLAGFAIAGLAAAGYRRRKTAIAAASAADQGIAA